MPGAGLGRCHCSLSLLPTVSSRSFHRAGRRVRQLRQRACSPRRASVSDLGQQVRVDGGDAHLRRAVGADEAACSAIELPDPGRAGHADQQETRHAAGEARERPGPDRPRPARRQQQPGEDQPGAQRQAAEQQPVGQRLPRRVRRPVDHRGRTSTAAVLPGPPSMATCPPARPGAAAASSGGSSGEDHSRPTAMPHPGRADQHQHVDQGPGEPAYAEVGAAGGDHRAAPPASTSRCAAATATPSAVIAGSARCQRGRPVLFISSSARVRRSRRPSTAPPASDRGIRKNMAEECDVAQPQPLSLPEAVHAGGAEDPDGQEQHRHGRRVGAAQFDAYLSDHQALRCCWRRYE